MGRYLGSHNTQQQRAAYFLLMLFYADMPSCLICAVCRPNDKFQGVFDARAPGVLIFCATGPKISATSRR